MPGRGAERPLRFFMSDQGTGTPGAGKGKGKDKRDFKKEIKSAKETSSPPPTGEADSLRGIRESKPDTKDKIKRVVSPIDPFTATRQSSDNGEETTPPKKKKK